MRIKLDVNQTFIVCSSNRESSGIDIKMQENLRDDFSQVLGEFVFYSKCKNINLFIGYL